MARPIYSSVMGWMASLISIFRTWAEENPAKKRVSRSANAMRDVFMDGAAAALSAPAWLQRRSLGPERPDCQVPNAGPDRLLVRLLLPYCLSNRAASAPETVPRTGVSAERLLPRSAPPPDRWLPGCRLIRHGPRRLRRSRQWLHGTRVRPR